ncbi:repeat element 27 protein [Diadegma fenestrale ichnovirus]|nr:repeat element 27 protein [Diadegma fenestrale ichnovirus]
MKMKSEQSTMTGLPSPYTSSVWSILHQLYIKCSVVKLFKFRSYPHIIQPLIRSNDKKKTSIVRKILWKSSTQKLKATFLNGKRLTIQYIFDPTKLDRENVLIKRDCLSPIFGGVVPAALDKFSTISAICSFVKTELNLDECQDGRDEAYCPCHPLHDCGEFYGIVEPVVDECLHQHFHHYCWEHVVSWLYNYLNLLILLQESKELFDEEIAELYSFFPNDISYFQTGNRTTPEFLLKTAVEVDAAIYESDGE